MSLAWSKINKGIEINFIVLLCIMIPCVLFGQIEICDNGIDDDNDNLIDLNDEDCFCEVVEPGSLISNPSFEEINCCPSFESQLDCAIGWIQASEPTTDLIHTCDWLGFQFFPPPEPFPDGEGIMGFRDGRKSGEEPYWKEYAGACLISPLLSGLTYRFQFDLGFINPEKSPPINISFFGTTDCQYLPFGIGDEAFGCPSNSPNWKKIADVTVSSGINNTWVNSFLEITPQDDIYAIAIGPDCSPSSSNVSTYYFFDNLQLVELRAFYLTISENLHPCHPNQTLSVPFNSEYEYQWYLSGVVLEGEVSSALSRNYGAGSYQIRVLDGTSCMVSANYEFIIPEFRSFMNETICEGDFFEFGGLELTASGIYTDTLQNQNNCDSIITFDLEVIGYEYDTLIATILEGETFNFEGESFKEEGDYTLVLTSHLGCDSLVLLKLTTFKIYIPNTFSPNFDGLNDVFHPYAKLGTIRSVDIQIFDRWGSLVYKGAKWDGYDTQLGVYVYLINIEFTNGDSKIFSGDVTLLR